MRGYGVLVQRGGNAYQPWKLCVSSMASSSKGNTGLMKELEGRGANSEGHRIHNKKSQLTAARRANRLAE